MPKARKHDLRHSALADWKAAHVEKEAVYDKIIALYKDLNALRLKAFQAEKRFRFHHERETGAPWPWAGPDGEPHDPPEDPPEGGIACAK